ncbi:hypothetical protein DNTS_023079 [Danionella cerebrum]|uniref:Enhancer of polycomb homolog n=1 Tax=Danionella cerebrum TaxID=2873325 RepID=A0A553QZN5_9TELE|nr:hypothetical protein DNTS_023079 [Danionella translucida]
MSKLSFRARALDALKPMPVYRCEDLPDLHEFASINRAVPQMPTGMEKDEELEHHLQRAISAQQVFGEKRDNMVIPVPEAESNIAYYDSLYPGDFKMPKQLIHIQPFSLDREQPDYDLDSEDEVFVNKLKKRLEVQALQFEEMIDGLEKGSGRQLLSLQEAKLLLKEDDEVIREVFEYWNWKRKLRKNRSVNPSIRQEKRDGSTTSDPYVAFRRRTEKMQTRKNRKNDEASYEKMLKLRRDLSRAVSILEMIKKREKSKQDLLHLTLELVEKRNILPDFGSEVMAEAQAMAKPLYKIPIIPFSSSSFYHLQDQTDFRDYKSRTEITELVRTKRKYEKKPRIRPLSAQLHSGSLLFNPKDLNQYDFPSSDDEFILGHPRLRRRASLMEHSHSGGKQDAGLGRHDDWSWSEESYDPRIRFSLTSLTIPHHCVGLARRRMGRGGRFLLDRAYSRLNGLYESLDSDSDLDISFPGSPLHTDTTCQAHTFLHTVSSSKNTSSCHTSHSELRQILQSIKTCRWRHFKPRTLTSQSGRADKPSQSTIKGLIPGGVGHCGTAVSRTAGTGRSTVAVTAEQYQQHQEQLVLMQKQQLEQIQQQTDGTATTRPLVTKTLDLVSAQFAASAIMTNDHSLTLRVKDDSKGGGVNGIIQASASNNATPTFLSSNSTHMAYKPIGNNGNCTTNSTSQVLIRKNLRLSVSAPSIISLNSRHLPRSLGSVPATTLKLTSNCQLPNVNSGENHEQEKQPLNSIAENTVAMEIFLYSFVMVKDAAPPPPPPPMACFSSAGIR